MKRIVPFALVITIGLILAAGCVATMNKNTVNSSSGATDSKFNATPTGTAQLKGSLSVSVAGFSYPSNLSVFLDNRTVGMVNPTSPLSLMVSEGEPYYRGLC